jgi:tripartite-type tricarboxylate transporter receptor subunit TctC
MVARISWLLRGTVAVLFLAAYQAYAQTYPSKPIHLISEHPGGSAPDIVLRAAAQELSPRLGQPFLIDTRPGANGIIATETCAKAAPDGHTMCLATSNTMSFNPLVFSKLPYDPDRDFKPVVRLFFLVQGLMVPAGLPADSLKSLEALANAKRGALNFGTQGPGSQQDVFRQYLADRWNTDIAGIPYKGAALIANALAAGDIHISLFGIGTGAGVLRSGRVKLLAIAGLKRYRRFPDVPLLSEAGIDFSNIPFWGIAVPAGSPDSAVTRLNTEFARLFSEPKFNEVLDNNYCDPAVGSPEEFAAFLRTDREEAARLVKKFNIPKT